MVNTSEDADTRTPSGGDGADRTPLMARTRLLALALLLLSLCLGSALAARGARVESAVAAAREAVSGVGPAPAVRRYSSARSVAGMPLPDAAAMDVVELDAPLMGDARVVLRDRRRGGTYTVVLTGEGDVSSLHAAGPFEAVVEAATGKASTETTPPQWQVASWDSSLAVPRETVATGGSDTAGDSVGGIEPTGTSVPLGSGVSVDPAGRSSSREGTGSISFLEPVPTQYSVLPMPGKIAEASDAAAVTDEWQGVTAELAGRTGYAAEATGTVVVDYQDHPALLSYAAYRKEGRLRRHYLLVVFLPESDRMAMVVRQSEGETSATASPVPPESQEGTPVAGSAVPTGAAEVAPVGDVAARDEMGFAADFARECGLAVGAREPVVQLTR